MRPETWTAAAGVLLLAVAVLWRQLVRWQSRRRLLRALADRDPVVRRAAVLVALEQGLRPYARLLLAHGERETHPEVTAALVEGVLRNTWEPADRRAILAIRVWAHTQTQRPQQATRPHLQAADETAVVPIRPRNTRRHWNAWRSQAAIVNERSG